MNMIFFAVSFEKTGMIVGHVMCLMKSLLDMVGL